MSSPRLKKQRCGECGGLVESVVLGRCPVCTRRLDALSGDWRSVVVLVRELRRHDDVRLELEVLPMPPDDLHALHARWAVHGRERWPTEQTFHARVGAYTSLPEAIVDAERFARRWIETAPGTSLATYVARPRI